jgi:hypothetical protein
MFIVYRKPRSSRCGMRASHDSALAKMAKNRIFSAGLRTILVFDCDTFLGCKKAPAMPARDTWS